MSARVNHCHLMNTDVDDEIVKSMRCMDNLYDLNFYIEQQRKINWENKIKETR